MCLISKEVFEGNVCVGLQKGQRTRAAAGSLCLRSAVNVFQIVLLMAIFQRELY